MVSLTTLKRLAREHGTPLFVVDHAELRRNYATFKKYLLAFQKPKLSFRSRNSLWL